MGVSRVPGTDRGFRRQPRTGVVTAVVMSYSRTPRRARAGWSGCIRHAPWGGAIGPGVFDDMSRTWGPHGMDSSESWMPGGRHRPVAL